ncbi:hypothetical protein F3Y22_tig00112863pilonHSYRG00016 [Hibiscus syriacus]|uniref:GIR1-like zinc ribbon domain-containing protein n=1 Tax=Hibiscus syriacus TaxID=106335 RepID=A0A6A2WS35_HIBSY|nr:uncharacterized protein LOC120184232 [Hibiscus syriacus]KAE8663922.1 hypothetical protein F3Y22_tig00112863pilonHSYRG00016 [Hibiscus syriacus]
MTARDTATITESLERSLKKCSLNHEIDGGSDVGGAAADEEGRRSGDDNNLSNTVSDTRLELNSHLSLPYHWEQCLDLKTGEIYYINWRNGTKASEDPRTAAGYGGDFYSDEDDDSLYDSDELSSDSSPSSSSRGKAHYNDDDDNEDRRLGADKDKDNVLVVAGCRSCLMYFMVLKQEEDCPKCKDHLLHFDRPETMLP